MAEPYDEQELLREIDRAEHLAGAITPLTYHARKCVEELIRQRAQAQIARERVAQLEQGQTLLPLFPPATAANNDQTHQPNQP